MKSIRKILCIIDPTGNEQQGSERAAMLAKRCDAELALFISRHSSYLNGIAADYGPGRQEFARVVIKSLRAQLEAMAEALREEGLTVTTHADWRPDLAGSILAEGRRIAADLIIKDTHYHSAIARALFSSTDWNLIRRSPLPLWLVKPAMTWSDKPKLLACVDPLREHDQPASLNDDILDTGRMLAGRLDGALHAVHWFNPQVPRGNKVPAAAAQTKPPAGSMSGRLWESHASAFAELVNRHDIPDSRQHLQTGAAQTLLPPLVDDLGVSLTIIGAVTNPRARHRLIGSTAESVLDRISSDLLILKPR